MKANRELKSWIVDENKIRKQNKIRAVFGAILGITALTFAVVWFSWKLALVLFLAIWGNNYQLRSE